VRFFRQLLRNYGFTRNFREKGVRPETPFDNQKTHSGSAFKFLPEFSNTYPRKKNIMSSPIPSNDGDLLSWLQNFAIKIPTEGPPLGLSAPQIASVTADCNMLIYLIQTYVGVTRQNAAGALQYKDLIKNGPIGTPSGGIPAAVVLPVPPPAVPAGALPRLRLLIQELKNKPSYNIGIGTNLGVTTNAASTNMDPPGSTVVDDHAGNVI